MFVCFDYVSMTNMKTFALTLAYYGAILAATLLASAASAWILSTSLH